MTASPQYQSLSEWFLDKFSSKNIHVAESVSEVIFPSIQILLNNNPNG